MVKCRVAYTINGQRASATVIAPSTFLALLRLLEVVPDGARVAAVVRVVKQ